MFKKNYRFENNNLYRFPNVIKAKQQLHLRYGRGIQSNQPDYLRVKFILLVTRRNDRTHELIVFKSSNQYTTYWAAKAKLSLQISRISHLGNVHVFTYRGHHLRGNTT